MLNPVSNPSERGKVSDTTHSPAMFVEFLYVSNPSERGKVSDGTVSLTLVQVVVGLKPLRAGQGFRPNG